MCEANAHLGTLALGSHTVTPDLRAAVAETDRIRTAARITMLEHFYAVAAQLPPDKRRDYLQKVLPLVIDSCGTR
jgi:head-tail adaptor